MLAQQGSEQLDLLLLIHLLLVILTNIVRNRLHHLVALIKLHSAVGHVGILRGRELLVRVELGHLLIRHMAVLVELERLVHEGLAGLHLHHLLHVGLCDLAHAQLSG